MTKRKRGHGEGTIRQLPSGRWVWIAMEGRKPDGSINYVRVHADTRRELTVAVEEYKQARNGNEEKKSVPSFVEYAADRWKRHKHNIRVSTQGSSVYVLKKLQEYWGDISVDQITASAIHDMLGYYDRDVHLSDSYIAKLRGMMHQIMKAAEADDLIRRNPVPYVVYRRQAESVPQNSKAEHKKDAFTIEEISDIYSAADSKIRDFVVIMIGVGLRPQEVLALKGRHIGSQGTSIKVENAVNMERSKPVVGLTKNTTSVRVVPVPAALQPVVAKYIAHGERLIWESTRVKGQSINPSAFRSQMRKLCKDTGVRCLTPHCGRHTCITQLRAHKVDSEIVKALVGHTRSDVTEGYNHIPWNVLVEAMDSLNDLFNKKTDPKRSA